MKIPVTITIEIPDATVANQPVIDHEPASPAQKDYIVGLGFTGDTADLSKHEASVIIASYMRKKKKEKMREFELKPRPLFDNPDPLPWDVKTQLVERMSKKRWSIKYESCLICHKTDKKHLAHGICTRCYYQASKKGMVVKR